MDKVIQLIQITPEELQNLIIEGVKTQLQEFFNHHKHGQTPEVESDLLTRDEVCALLSFNKTSLWKHTKSGKLKSYGMGDANRVYYKRSEVLEAIKPINH